MINESRLNKHLAALNTGDDNAQREALRSLRAVEQEYWNTASPEILQSVLDAFHGQVLRPNKLGTSHKDLAVILNSLGPLSKSAVSQLREMLQDGVPDCVREAVAAALGKLGGKAKSAASRLAELASAPSALARHAVGALGEIGCVDPPVRSVLVELWRTPAHSYEASVQLAITLCKLEIQVDGLSAFLVDTLLDNQSEGVRIAAATGLSLRNKNDRDVVPALLLAHTSDKSEVVRAAALDACVRLCHSHENAIQQCAKLLKDSRHAEAALRKTGASTVPALINALDATDAEVRLKAFRILSSFGELAVASVKELTRMLRDRDPEIRLAAAKCLWNVTKNADAVVPVFVELLDDRQAVARLDDDARRTYLQTVLEALSRIGPPAVAAVPAIQKRSKDQNRLVSQSAHEALKKIQSGKGGV